MSAKMIDKRLALLLLLLSVLVSSVYSYAEFVEPEGRPKPDLEGKSEDEQEEILASQPCGGAEKDEVHDFPIVGKDVVVRFDHPTTGILLLGYIDGFDESSGVMARAKKAIKTEKDGENVSVPFDVKMDQGEKSVKVGDEGVIQIDYKSDDKDSHWVFCADVKLTDEVEESEEELEEEPEEVPEEVPEEKDTSTRISYSVSDFAVVMVVTVFAIAIGTL